MYQAKDLFDLPIFDELRSKNLESQAFAKKKIDLKVDQKIIDEKSGAEISFKTKKYQSYIMKVCDKVLSGEPKRPVTADLCVGVEIRPAY